MKSKLLFLTIVLLASPVFAVPTVHITVKDGYYSGGTGGEFTMTPSAELAWVLDYYDSSARGDNDFQTFCAEKEEDIFNNNTYIAYINDTIISGNGAPGGEPLTIGAAWLYHEFQNGVLQGYDYTPGDGRAASAGELQDTLWWLQGDISDPGNSFSALVVSEFGSAANAMVANNHYYPVAVLNLYDEAGARIQDVFVCIPAPGAILLAGLGAGFVGFLRRKQAL